VNFRSILPGLFDDSNAVPPDHELPGQEAPVDLDDVLVGLDRVGKEGGLRGLRVGAEEQGDRARYELPVEEGRLEGPAAQVHGRDVVPKNREVQLVLRLHDMW